MTKFMGKHFGNLCYLRNIKYFSAFCIFFLNDNVNAQILDFPFWVIFSDT